jgi:hypothetical protein
MEADTMKPFPFASYPSEIRLRKGFDQANWEKKVKKIKESGGATDWEPTRTGFDNYSAEQYHSSAANQEDIPAAKRLWHMGQASTYRIKNAAERELRTAGIRQKEQAKRQEKAERLARYQANRSANPRNAGSAEAP